MAYLDGNGVVTLTADIKAYADATYATLGHIHDGMAKIKERTSADWDADSTYIPEEGELCIWTDYTTIDDKSIPAFKVGDGITNINDLPFVSAGDVGIPTGGTTGQILKKKSGSDFDVEWDNEVEAPVQDVQIDGASIVDNGVANIPTASSQDDGLMSSDDYTKLGGIASGAEVNQNAFSNIKVGDVTIEADSKTDALELVAGSNVTLTPDVANDKVTVDATNTTYAFATGDRNGQIKVTPSDGRAQNIDVQGLGTAAFTESSDYATSSQGEAADNAMPRSGGTFTGRIKLSNDPLNDLDAATKHYVDNAVAEGISTSDAMVFKGTLGVNGTVNAVPTSGVVKGDTYKIITAGTYAESACKVGDLLIALNNGNVSATSANWAYVPSGDENINVEDVQINGTSIVSSGVANIPIASNDNLGVVKVYYHGLLNDNGFITTDKADLQDLRGGQNGYKPVVASNAHIATFYGLAKASGDSTQSASANAVGSYTDSAKAKIQNMLGTADASTLGIVFTGDTATSAVSEGDFVVWNGKLYKASTDIASGSTLSSGNLDEVAGGGLNDVALDVQINGSSIVNDGVANIPYASSTNFGVGKISTGQGINLDSVSKTFCTVKAPSAWIQAGTQQYCPIVPYNQHEATFYGLAKAAGDSTQSASSNTVGTYTDSAKTAIKSMLGITDPTSLVSYSTIIGDGTATSFTINHGLDSQSLLIQCYDINSTTGALENIIGYYTILDSDNVKVDLTSSPAINGVKVVIISTGVYNYVDQSVVNDVKINNTSVVTSGIANIPLITGNNQIGVIQTNDGYGLKMRSDGCIRTNGAETSHVKTGTNIYLPLTPNIQHTSTFYGLAKAAGDTTQSASSNAVGTYTDEAKTKIQQMLGVKSATPKLYKKYVIAEDGGSSGQLYFNGGLAVPFNIYDEMVIHIYQSDRETHGSAIGTGSFGYIQIRDTTNDTYTPLAWGPNSYINETQPVIIKYKRLPYSIMAEMFTNGSIKNGYEVRDIDYVDQFMWFSINGNNATLYAGTTIEVYII